MTDRPDWTTDGAGWPNRAASRFVAAGGLRWHVQQAGAGPVLLMVHGTGAATHSWGGLLPLLMPHFTLIASDLPGHGFTSASARMSLPNMAQAVAALLDALEAQPAYCVGHSAGAAILARMCLDRLIAPAILFSLNGALLPPRGMPMHLLSPLARLLSANPLVPRMFAWRAADRGVIERLLRQTGSTVPAESVEFYARLARRSGHAAGALAMMGQWNLQSLADDMPRLKTALVMINGGNDRTIPPGEGGRVQALVAGARLVMLPGLGHLAHEEAPAQVAEIIIRVCAGGGVA